MQYPARREEVLRGRTTTNIPPIQRYKNVSTQRLDGEVVSTVSTVQKRDGQTKNIELFRPRRSPNPNILDKVVEEIIRTILAPP